MPFLSLGDMSNVLEHRKARITHASYIQNGFILHEAALEQKPQVVQNAREGLDWWFWNRVTLICKNDSGFLVSQKV